jgi:hypothetical protein
MLLACMNLCLRRAARAVVSDIKRTRVSLGNTPARVLWTINFPV